METPFRYQGLKPVARLRGVDVWGQLRYESNRRDAVDSGKLLSVDVNMGMPMVCFECVQFVIYTYVRRKVEMGSISLNRLLRNRARKKRNPHVVQEMDFNSDVKEPIL